MQRIAKISKFSFKHPQTRSKYCKISTKAKESLYNLIYFNGKKIKEVIFFFNY